MVPARALAISVALCLEVVASAPATANAQDGVTVQPDVVVLRSGAMVRGTIVEVRPDDGLVVLLAPDGSTRTFATDEVEYAGSAERAPDRVWVGGEDDEDSDAEALAHESSEGDAPETSDELVELEVHARGPYPIVAEPATGGRRMALCVAPCAARLPPGSYHFGVRVDDDAPLRGGVAMDEAVIVLDEPTDIWVRFGDREAMRVVGALVTVLSVLATATGIVASFFVSDEQRWTAIGITGASASILFGVGVPLALVHDSVRVDLVPR